MNDEYERLYESDSFEHYEGTAGYLLFTTGSAIFPFIKYEEQLAEINDYCVYLLKALKEKVAETKATVQRIDDNYAQGVQSDQEVFDYHFDRFLSWKYLYQDINKCVMLLLLLAFFESTLNEIAGWFSSIADCSSEWKKVRNPKVSEYLSQIGKCCNGDLQNELADELAYYDIIRKTRNQFIHKEWDQTTDRYEKFVLADVIDMISRVIMKVEQSALSSRLIE